MSKNICPCCGGKSEYIDIAEENTERLCAGCEIKLYFPLHRIMSLYNVNKEEAYKILRERDNESKESEKDTTENCTEKIEISMDKLVDIVLGAVNYGIR